LGFGNNVNDEFCIIVDQPFIQGSEMTNEEIKDFAMKLGFSSVNPRNWTYATTEVYLSDLHDENVLKSTNANVFVIDCDIRINVPELRCGGMRKYSTEISFLNQ
jgi:hypothetical protein